MTTKEMMHLIERVQVAIELSTDRQDIMIYGHLEAAHSILMIRRIFEMDKERLDHADHS